MSGTHEQVLVEFLQTVFIYEMASAMWYFYLELN